MKKMIILMILNVSAFAQGFEFKIKPGTEEWKKLQTYDEMINVCQIPDSLLKKISTKELINICLDYPLLYSITYFNTPQNGFDNFKSNFNGVRELLKRPDLPKLLISSYILISPSNYKKEWNLFEKGTYSFKISAIELILAQSEVVDILNNLEKKNLINLLLTKDIEKSKNDIFFNRSYITISFAISRLIYSDKSKRIENDSIYNFSKMGNWDGIKNIPKIKELANNYLSKQ